MTVTYNTDKQRVRKQAFDCQRSFCDHDVEDGIEVSCIVSGLYFRYSLDEIYDDLLREKSYASVT